MTKLLRRIESFLRNVLSNIATGVRMQLCTYPLVYATLFIVTLCVLMPGLMLMLAVVWLSFAAVNVLCNNAMRSNNSMRR